MKSKQYASPGTVEDAPRLSIGFRRIPDDLAIKSYEFGDQRSERRDADFPTRANVHWFGIVVILRREHHRLCCVIDVKEIARGGTGAPYVNGRCSGALRYKHLPN